MMPALSRSVLACATVACVVGAAASTSAGAQQQPAPTFTVGTATASRGATAVGVIPVPAGSDSGLNIPVAVIHGAQPGPVVAFVAGSHGTEYTSIVALQRLIPRIDPRHFRVTRVIVPILNIPSIETMTPHVNPVDRKGRLEERRVG